LLVLVLVLMLVLVLVLVASHRRQRNAASVRVACMFGYSQVHHPRASMGRRD